MCIHEFWMRYQHSVNTKTSIPSRAGSGGGCERWWSPVCEPVSPCWPGWSGSTSPWPKSAGNSRCPSAVFPTPHVPLVTWRSGSASTYGTSPSSSRCVTDTHRYGSFQLWIKCGWQVKLCDPSLTRAIHERFQISCLRLSATQIYGLLIRSTHPSRPNKVGLKCLSARPYVRSSTKSFFDFNEIWYVG